MIRNAAIAGAVALGAVGVGAGWTIQQNVLADDGAAATIDAPAGVDLDGDGVISEDERVTPSALYFDCPGGAALGELHDGDRILTVGTHDSVDGWLALRKPLDPSETVWIAAPQVDPDGDLDALPPLACANGDAIVVTPPAEDDEDPDTTEVAAPDETTTTTEATGDTTPTTRPQSTTTRPQSTTTTTKPTATTTPTTAGDTAGPGLTGVTAVPNPVYEDEGGFGCPSGERSTEISAVANDPSGVDKVTLRVENSQGDFETGGTMSFSAGKWRRDASVNHRMQSAGETETMFYRVTAFDDLGNTSTASGTYTLRSAESCFG